LGEEELNNSLFQNAFFFISKDKKNKEKRIYFKLSSPNPLQQERASELYQSFYAE